MRATQPTAHGYTAPAVHIAIAIPNHFAVKP
jgi:hypothetical protein